MYIYLHTYIYIHMHTYVHIHINIYIYMHMHIYIYIYISISIAYAQLLRTYLESCANIVQAVICHPPSCRLALTRPPLSPDAVRLRNPSKSTLAHDAVAAAVLHKHHPIIRVGAGLIQFVYGSRSHLAAEATHHKNAFSPFSCEFSYPD